MLLLNLNRLVLITKMPKIFVIVPITYLTNKLYHGYICINDLETIHLNLDYYSKYNYFSKQTCAY